MRIVHVVASIDDEAAGPSVSVPRLAEAQSRAGAQAEIATVDGWMDRSSAHDPSVPHTRHARSFSGVPVLSALAASQSMRVALRRQALHADILHGHGLWLMPNVYPAAAAAQARAKFVLSPRGMLSQAALHFSSGKKRLFWEMFQKSAARSAALLHATSEAEAQDIRAAGLTAPIVIVRNGVDIPPQAACARTSDRDQRTVLSLGRVHPKKGLDHLVRAWAAIEADFPDWRLRIVGPAELGFDDRLRALAAELSLEHVSIEGPLYGEEKLAAYREAGLFVLPTLSENFAMTVAEALAAGTPVISTKGAPWAGLSAEQCGWWIDQGPVSIAAALRVACALPAARLDEMGARGRAWMAREFSWDRAAQDILSAYSWIVGAGPRPAAMIA